MFSQTIIVGNLGRDVELRYTSGGKPVAEFSVATSRKWGGNNPGEETTWWKVTAWGNLAETCNQYLKKGSRVLVSGSQVKASAWSGQDGEARATLELTANTVKFLNTPAGSNAGMPEAEEDLPF